MAVRRRRACQTMFSACKCFDFIHRRKEDIMRNRLAFVLVSALLLFAPLAYSQGAIQPGLFAGAGVYRFYESNPTSSLTSNTSTGFLAGGVLSIAFSRYFAFEPGIMYSGRGGAALTPFYDTLDKDVGATTGKLKFNYVAIPLDLKLKLPFVPIVTPYGLAGFNIGFLVYGTESNTVAGVTKTAIIDKDFHEDDYGINLGGGFEFSAGPIVPFAEASYLFGLANIANVADVTAHNKGLEIKAGLRFQ